MPLQLGGPLRCDYYCSELNCGLGKGLWVMEVPHALACRLEPGATVEYLLAIPTRVPECHRVVFSQPGW